ncbi:MAG: hypothetical protein EPO24_12470 [Bacteroidetes bacterium]|nr:MAG: hypothetical protein EPO24_12470 [Bacteroidota bacterium]
MKNFVITLVIACFLLSGCDKPGPIELVDSDTPARSIEIDTTGEDNGYLSSSNPEIDSSGYFITLGGRSLGLIMVAGALYDGVNEQHNASVAQAFFFNQQQPVIYQGDTVAFKIMNAGDLRVEGLLLARYQRRFIVTRVPFLDTLLGFQYGLYSKDGIGGRGFEYSGNRVFRWEGSGAIGFPAFKETLRTAPMIRVLAPLPNNEIERTKNLRVQIAGDAGEILIFIRRKPLVGSEFDQKPLLKLRAVKIGNGITIPSAVLRLLPKEHVSFLFSFQVETNRLKHINGYPSDVLLKSSYVHHVVFRVKQ